MARLMRPGEVVDLVPADQEGLPEGERITYHLRVPTLYERIAYRRAVAEKGGHEHKPLDLLRCLRRGVAELMEESENTEAREFILAAIDEQEAGLLGFYRRVRDREFDLATDEGLQAFVEAAKATERTGARLAEIASQVQRGYPPYGAMMGDLEVYAEIAGIEGARLFLEGWQGLGPDFRRARLGVPDELLEAIPPPHFAVIAAKVADLMRPSEAAEKNLDSPSPTSDSGATSTAERTPRRKAR